MVDRVGPDEALVLLLTIRARSLHLLAQGLLDAGHGFLGGRVGEAAGQLVRCDLLDLLVQPPQVPLRVTDAGDDFAEGKWGRDGHWPRRHRSDRLEPTSISS